ncbi:bifunctional metallophosphatase/5'-nucleotidase [Heyndrickxia acidicola]|uniref:Bifunctional UDP-sugar hydrolase/5'-nucleotidase n=1 Tax=Heyndrickxia acidicola TaxID=209389 RepID=A0ABU6MMI9_9BACI|nr:bifunctional UDP-sugar hydrolase/5'-nucleotidase [Heyndrickxia acidicola]MED1205891.1 bifunctional UDP-sugar hydrolase/5'-nucleotidase [Heyndrickxia acidicola]
MTETIHIYHTNDIHSHFENWPKIRHFLQEKKSGHARDGEEVFLFDIGDHVDRWHPYTEGTLGKGNIKLLNDLGYTAATIGNNEGITLAHHDLDELYHDRAFDLILANLYKENGNQRPAWTIPRKIYQTKHGIKIGVTAVTAYFEKLYRLLGWQLREPFTELSDQLAALKEEADIIILLSHLGIQDDEKIAELYPEVDLILGGHTHHVLQHGRRLNQSLLGAGGKHGHYVGYVQLQLDKVKKKVTEKSAVLFETGNLEPPASEEKEIQWFQEQGRALMNHSVATLPESLMTEWFQESLLPSYLCEALAEWCEADCAFLQSGLVMGNLKKGVVTDYDVHRILPHPINPCSFKLSGKDLESVILQTLNPDWPEWELKGLGFRGEILGVFVYRNIEINKETSEINIKGKKLDRTKEYTLATVDMYTFGHFFPELYRLPKKYHMPEFLRDVLKWKLRRDYL